METARIVCEQIHLAPSTIIVEPLLIEHDVGSWQGLTDREIEARFPGALASRDGDKWNYTIPGGESYAVMSLRAKAWLEKKNACRIRIAVTHEMLSRTIQGAYKHMQPEQTLKTSHDQDCIYRLEEGEIAAFRCNDTVDRGGDVQPPRNEGFRDHRAER